MRYEVDIVAAILALLDLRDALVLHSSPSFTPHRPHYTSTTCSGRFRLKRSGSYVLALGQYLRKIIPKEHGSTTVYTPTEEHAAFVHVEGHKLLWPDNVYRLI